jgi:hypothetical protein
MDSGCISLWLALGGAVVMLGCGYLRGFVDGINAERKRSGKPPLGSR